ncbi:hypothetical protein GCM10009664_59380 [Kitasatospora gansuensis]
MVSDVGETSPAFSVVGAHQDLAASRAGDPRDEDDADRVLAEPTRRLLDTAAVFKYLQMGWQVISTALEDPGRKCLPLAPYFREYGDLRPDRLADRYLMGEDPGDEQAEPRLLLPDAPAVPDLLGLGLR